MKKAVYIVLALSALLTSCKKDTGLKTPEKSLIVGLASPITLGADTTVIILKDYFPETEKIIASTSVEGLANTYIINKGELLLVGSITQPIANLHVEADGFGYDIPLRKSRKNKVAFTFDPKGKTYNKVEMAGSFNGWTASKNPLVLENGIWKTTLSLNEGEHQYKLHLDGIEGLDPNNTDSIDNGIGGYNSILVVGNPNAAKPSIATQNHTGSQVTFLADSSISTVLAYWENYLLPASFIKKENNTYTVTLPKNAEKMERSHLRIYASSAQKESNDILIPLDKSLPVTQTTELSRTDKQNYVMYFLMVDRFNNGRTDNDKKVQDTILPIANYLGGDLAGITQKIKNGYFDSLGTNTVWLSPVSQNPEGAWGLWNKGGIYSKFAGYHGYWPISHSQVDYRFGTNDELKELISVAHQHNVNVVLDYVANHVHKEHPMIVQHPDWSTPMILPDGRRNLELWDEQRLTTWFDTFLPTLDLEREEVRNAATDSAMFWLTNFDLDGLRHDATKHIPESYWRLLTYKIKTQVIERQNRTLYQIGETYGSPELINSYVSTGQLDGQFDFNVYDAAVACFARDNEPFIRLQKTLNESFDYYGYHNLMGNISGNQDKVRFISYADGSVSFDEDSKQAGWTRHITNNGQKGYDRLAMLNAFNLTIPGIPVIYYGDEIGLPGANDPDNRRMMLFDSLTSPQSQLKGTVTQLVQLRRNTMALLYGDTRFVDAGTSTFAYVRNYFDKTAIVVFNKGEEQKITLTLPTGLNYEKLKANFGNAFTLSGNTLTLTLNPNSFEIITN